MNASIISIIISVAFALMLVAGFLIGMWRGFKRAGVNILMSLAGAVVAFFVTPFIAKALLGIKFNFSGEIVSIGEFAIYFASKNADVSQIIEANSNLKTLMLNLPNAILSALLFILVTLVVQGIIYIVYIILAKTTIKYKIGQTRHRVLGGLVGLVKMFILTLFVCMPFASLIGLASSITTNAEDPMAFAEEAQTENNKSLISGLPKQAVSIIEGAENSILVKSCSVFGLDDMMFDYYGQVRIDGEKVVIRKEIKNTYNLINLGYYISQNFETSATFTQLDYENISKAVNAVVDGGLFKTVVAETVGDMLENYKDYEIISNLPIVQENPEIFDGISAGLANARVNGNGYYEYFANDLNCIIDIFEGLSENEILEELGGLEDKSVEGILMCLTSTQNISTFRDTVLKAFDINLLKDTSGPIIKLGVDMLVGETEDNPNASTQSWDRNKWDEVANSLVDIIDNYSDITQDINLTDVLSDATILLDEVAKYDIATISSKLGRMIDKIRTNDLLKTTGGGSIFDSLLETNNIQLPSEPVYNVDGTEREITNYQQLFEFISPALIKLRDEDSRDGKDGLYKILTSSAGSANDKLIDVAKKISETGKANLLSEIILPLIQVEPTKTLIADELTDTLASEFVDFNRLDGFADWKKDLGQLSEGLINLQKQTHEETGETYLSLVLENKATDMLIDMLEVDGNLDKIKPLVYAKSTRGFIFKQIESNVNSFTGKTIDMPTEHAAFDQADVEDQTEEFIDVVEGLVAISATGKTTIREIDDKMIMATTLDAMKLNAYRTTLASKIVEGIFGGENGALYALMDKFKAEYAVEISMLQYVDNALYTKLTTNDYANINFTELMSKLG